MNRTRRSRQESHVAGLARAVLPNNRTCRLTWRPTLNVGILVLVAAATAGCSLSIPLSSLKTDDMPTGSIDRSAPFMASALDREDLRRARAALSVALDPQGNGAPVNWQNPQTGAKGSFAAAAAPFTDHDRVCRDFAADVDPPDGTTRHLTGSACRDGDGIWKVRSSEDGRKA